MIAMTRQPGLLTEGTKVLSFWFHAMSTRRKTLVEHKKYWNPKIETSTPEKLIWFYVNINK